MWFVIVPCAFYKVLCFTSGTKESKYDRLSTNQVQLTLHDNNVAITICCTSALVLAGNKTRQPPRNHANKYFKALQSSSLVMPTHKDTDMSMHKVKYPTGDGVVCMLGDSCLVHGLAVDQRDSRLGPQSESR